MADAALTAATVEAALLGILSSDDAIRQQAERFVASRLSRDTVAGPLYAQLVACSADDGVRQLAGVLLRRHVNGWYGNAKTSKEVRRALLQQLVATVVTEASRPAASSCAPGTRPFCRPVCKALISVMAALGKTVAPATWASEWPELVHFMRSCAGAASPLLRELGLILLREEAEFVGAKLHALSDVVLPMLDSALSAPETPVQVAGLRALGTFLSVVSDDERVCMRYSSLVGPLIRATEQLLGKSDEAVIASLDVLAELIDIDSPLVGGSRKQDAATVPLLLGLGTRALSSDALDMATRGAGWNLLKQLITSKPTALERLKLYEPLVHLCLSLLSTFDPEVEEENVREARAAGIEAVDFIDDNAWNIGCWMLDLLAMTLPASKIASCMRDAAIPALLSEASSWRQKYAALMGLAVISQGCSDVYQQNLPQLLDLLLPFASNPHPSVRGAAAWALVQFAEFLPPRIVHFHARILPVAFALLDDPSPSVVQNALQVVEGFFDDTASPAFFVSYVPPFMAKLGALLSAPGQDITLQEMVVAALCSVASGAGASFVTYLPGVMPTLLSLMALSDLHHLRLRAKATEAAGHVAEAVGLQQFLPYLAPCLSLASAGYALDNLELKENTFAFFGSIAEVLGGSDDPAGRARLDELLPQIVPVALDVARSNEGLDFIPDDGSDAGGERLADRLAELRGEDAAEASDDEDGNGGDDNGLRVGDRVNYRVHTSVMDLRVSAIVCLGRCARHAGPSFAPYLADAKKTLEDLVTHFHEEMREQAVASLILLAFAFNTATPPIPGAAGEPLRMRSPALEAYNDIVTVLLSVLRSEGSLGTVAQACVGVQKFCKQWGAGALVRHHEALMAALLVILHERASCQLLADEDGEEEGEEEAEEAPSGGRRGRVAAALAAAAAAPMPAPPLPAPFSLPGAEPASHKAGAHGHSHGGVACHGHGHAQRGVSAAAAGEAGDDDDGDDSVVEHDDVLIDEAVDAVGGIAAALGAAFAPYLPATVSAALRFMGPQRSVTDRTMGVGFIADLARWTGSEFAPFVPTVVPHVLMSLGAADQPGLQRNAAFAVGQLLTHVTAAARPFAGQLLSALQPLFAVPRGNSESEHLIDNAASALAAAATALPDLVPAAVAVPAVASKLPITADTEEAGVVLRYLLAQLHALAPPALSALPQIVLGCATALAPGSDIPADVQQGVIAPGLRHFLRVGGGDARSALAAAAAALPSDGLRAALAAALQGAPLAPSP